jgi:phage/plasmid-like protein (TIGR03299 family)
MAHNLFQGRMAFVDTTPWHGLGKQVTADISAQEMCRDAGLDWSVTKEAAPGARIIDEKKDLHDRYLILRDPVAPEKEPVALGMVGSGYEPLQNRDAFKFMEPFIDNGYAQFHTAGALGNGERVWVLAKLNGQIAIHGDDVIDRFLLVSNSHNGSGAVSVRFTPIRVVCQNTLNFAHEKSSGVISVRHTKHINRNLARAQVEELRLIIEKVFSEAHSLFGRMAMINLKAADIDLFLEAIFPRTSKQKNDGLEPDRWGRIKIILADGRITPAKTRHTLWALYNAIVRDEDYRSSTEAAEDARLARVWFGRGHDLKIKVLDACRKQLKAA